MAALRSRYGFSSMLAVKPTAQDSGGHDGAVFGEGVRRESWVAVLLGTGRDLGDD
jgi:hypothetical protein